MLVATPADRWRAELLAAEAADAALIAAAQLAEHGRKQPIGIHFNSIPNDLLFRFLVFGFSHFLIFSFSDLLGCRRCQLWRIIFTLR